MTIDPGTSSVVATLSCLDEHLHAIFWTVFTGFSSFYASLRICSSFRNREEPLTHFQKRFFLFLALQKLTMVFKKKPLNDIVENFDDMCYVDADAKQYHLASFSTRNSTLNTSLR